MRQIRFPAPLSPPKGRRAFSPQRACTWGTVIAAITLVIIFGQYAQLQAQTGKTKAPDVTGYYQFRRNDTLAILDEHGNLLGHVDFFEPSGAPGPVLSYNITHGWIKGRHLEFKTQRIYGKRYHFSGALERGAGKAPGDYDYFQLAGNLETITESPATGKVKVDSCHTVFKSLAQEQGGS